MLLHIVLYFTILYLFLCDGEAKLARESKVAAIYLATAVRYSRNLY